ncbi:response regulator transcription factor [Lutibaculum baratangense]|uniref:Response regulator n=1 Tax=Lutibaculum baratangense AMV1 TaxID=631454 RepID=V4RV30_9HYPH|nr:response regulator [Lutibaculum baratangense]ESR26875.1 Response regulator [Lutibaculum baratangense AMV1]
MNTVSLIDDDPGVLDAVGTLFETKGLSVNRHASAVAFLKAPVTGGCVVSDLRMPELNGLELVRLLKAEGDPRPIILLTAHGDVELAVRALKAGAFDFIEKPFEEERLLAAVTAALEAGQRSAVRASELSDLKQRYDSLSERQKEVMWLVVSGCANKEVAARLEISIRTVETYRAWVFEKMGVKTLPELVRQSIALEELVQPEAGEPTPAR